MAALRAMRQADLRAFCAGLAERFVLRVEDDFATLRALPREPDLAGALAALLLPPPSRLCFSAAIRSMTLPPLGRSSSGLDLRRLALHALVDQLAQRLVVIVLEGGRVERRGLALDQLLGDGEQILVGLRAADLGEDTDPALRISSS